MAENGVKISDNDVLASAEYLLVLNEGTSGLFTVAGLGTLLAGGGPVYEALALKTDQTDTDALEERVSIVEATTTVGAIPRDPVDLLADGNIVLSGEQTIDGTLTSGSVVAVAGQSNPAQNGVYITAAGAWTRRADMDAASEINLSSVFVEGGTSNGGERWIFSVADSGTFVLGTDDITVTKIGDAGAVLDYIDAELADKLDVANGLSELAGQEATARSNIGAASQRDVTSLRARSLYRDGFQGWAAPVYDREDRIGGGWKRDGTFHARGFGVGASSAPARDVPRTPLAQGNANRVALSVDEAGMLRGKGFATPAPVAPARDVPHLPVVHDLFGRASIALEPSGAVVLPKISERTAQMIRALVGVSESIPGGLLEGLPGWNHRVYDEDYYLLTMPTKMGPVDVLYPVAGAGLQFAATRKPVELLSVSGQSNTFLGGDMDAGINGFVLRGVHDPHRAFRSAHGNSWGDGSGSAAAY
ncbi:MAG: hypothetical protein GYB51_24515, partial [Rhodobacteraceae bacterium]|nr:hypothetical protein [Paracoccaceae bacterium]